jgi:hypothetical protein
MTTLIDLHTHSHHSDGTLAPEALAQAAGARGVRLLALTDHDTTAGLGTCAAACRALGIEPVAGVEVTSLWRGQEIHVVGLGIDPAAADLVAHLSDVVRRRRLRIAAILERLRRSARLAASEHFGNALAGLEVPTRTHVARELMASGAADSVQAAFDRWLARGRPGHVPADMRCWPIRTATGSPPAAAARCWANSPPVAAQALNWTCRACRRRMPRSLRASRVRSASPAPRVRISMSRASRGAPWGASLSYRPGSSRSGRASPRHRSGDGMSDDTEDNVDRELFRNIEKLRQLRIEHRDLDQVISRLQLDMHIDEVQIRRLKKRKLLLKDQITILQSQAIPDLNA